MKIVIPIVFLLMMITLTGLEYLLQPGLVGGSTNSMEVVAAAPIFLPIILLVLFCLLSYWNLKKPANIKICFLGLCILFWFASGRVVSILVWPDARINTGWFNAATEEIKLCNVKNDCETVMTQKTQTENLFFWRIRIKNENIDRIIFVGPFLWSKTVRMFTETFSSRKLALNEPRLSRTTLRFTHRSQACVS